MGAAAAILIRKEKDLVAHFRQHGALSSATAKTANELGVDQRLAWAILRRREIIREATPGIYYLDEPAWTAHRAAQRRVALVGVTIGLLAALISFFVVKR